MRIKHPVAQAVVIIIASLAVAVVANAFRGPTRQLKLPGWYPNATTAPKRAAQPAAVASVTATTEQSPAPGNPPIVIPTGTIANTTTGQTDNPTTPPTTTQQPSTPATQQPPATRQPDNPATPSVDLSKFTPHPDKPYIEISGDDAVALHKSGALFLDARRTEIFQEGHIPGARSYSVWEADVDDKVTALYEERSDPAEQNKPIVIYCSGGACEDSHMLSQKLWGVQFNNVYVYKDGFPDWQQRGLPVRKGATP